MFNKILIIILICALPGCSTVERFVGMGEVELKNAERVAAKANDLSLMVSILNLCKGGSVGAVGRFLDTPEKRVAWGIICHEEDQTPLIFSDNLNN